MKSENHELNFGVSRNFEKTDVAAARIRMVACGMGFRYSGIRDESTMQITARGGFYSTALRLNQYAIQSLQEVFVSSRIRRMDFESVISRS